MTYKNLLKKASESQVQKAIRDLAYAKGDFLERNNVGVWISDSGRPVRYGLCNESSRVNSSMKSSDLIGARRVLITQEMVGKYIAQYTAIEVKKEGWVYKGTKHEQAQKAYIDYVNSKGGYAKFITDAEDLYASS